MSGWIVFGVVAILVVAFFIFGAYVGKANRKSLESRFPNSLINILNQDYLVVDHENSRIAIGRFGNPKHDKKAFDIVVPASAIKGARLEVDDVVVADSNGSNAATGALVGGMLAGPMGALGGAIGASVGGKKITTSSKGVKKLTLVIHALDRERPHHRLEFFSSSTPVKSNDSYFKERLAKAETNLAHILNLMESAAQGREPVTAASRLAQEPVPVAPALEGITRSVTDEIRELWALKESGALTQDEFDRGKARLLASG